jgi:hypothetical protein
MGGCGVAFLAAAPYTLLDLPGFLNGFAYLARCYVPRDPGAEPGWLVYLKHVRLAVGWPATIVLAAGLGFAAARATQGPGRARWALLLAFPLAYFAAISERQLLFGRYLLPIYPFLCILIGTTVVSGVSLLRRFDIPRAPRTALIAALTIAILLPPALQAVGFDRMIGRRTTQSAAYEWIQQHVPPSAAVVVEGWVVRLPSPPYRPSFVRSLTEWNWDDIAGGGHEYVVATSEQFGRAFDQPERHPKASAAYRHIFDQSTEVFRVEPSVQLVGPEIRVFKLKR